MPNVAANRALVPCRWLWDREREVIELIQSGYYPPPPPEIRYGDDVPDGHYTASTTARRSQWADAAERDLDEEIARWERLSE